MKSEDLIKKLNESRIALISSDKVMCQTMELILTLKAFDEKPNEPIQLFISSQSMDHGGMLAIYDTIKTLKSPVFGTAIGQIGTYEALILSSCTKGHRTALKHTKILLTQPYGIITPGPNQQTEIKISAKEATHNRREIEQLLSDASGQSLEKIHKDLDDELELDAEEAIKYRIIDKVL